MSANPAVPAPDWLSPNTAYIPNRLKECLYVNWRAQPRKGGKPSKQPINPLDGTLADVTDPETWGTFEQAVIRCKEDTTLDGIGIVLHGDKLVAIDLDNCVKRETGAIDAWALSIVRFFNSYTELSPSGTGLRIMVRGTFPEDYRKEGNIEASYNRRFVTLTGWHKKGSPWDACPAQEHLDVFYALRFASAPRKQATGETPIPITKRLADDHLIKRARTSDPTFDALWRGDTSGYDHNHSDADAALCIKLAFWTGRDREAIDRHFRQSGLYDRDKWDERHYQDGRTYGEGLIDWAVTHQPDVYTGARVPQPDEEPTDKDELIAYLCAKLKASELKNSRMDGLMSNHNIKDHQLRAIYYAYQGVEEAHEKGYAYATFGPKWLAKKTGSCEETARRRLDEMDGAGLFDLREESYTVTNDNGTQQEYLRTYRAMPTGTRFQETWENPARLPALPTCSTAEKARDRMKQERDKAQEKAQELEEYKVIFARCHNCGHPDVEMVCPSCKAIQQIGSIPDARQVKSDGTLDRKRASRKSKRNGQHHSQDRGPDSYQGSEATNSVSTYNTPPVRTIRTNSVSGGSRARMVDPETGEILGDAEDAIPTPVPCSRIGEETTTV